ncbi:hypothetical protein ARMSODRAFT_950582 [Armillaria solidipes]|uniref:F-box domain-containing protein n=1 Tax=Armillaria solidipes TaxID=1076256 RepID=A0A2H3BZC5_9AGAR|nr:hypothetical protein ARMSODRAFT_950582 [Armillaria solidipes]
MAPKRQTQITSPQTLTKDSSNFPPELVLEILEHVNCSDFDSLFNCCLVSRAWRQLAQPFVFVDLRLSLESKSALWIERLEEAPHLAEYVKGLHMWGSDWEDTNGFPDHPQFLEGSNTYDVVRRLPDIKRLKVCGFSYPFGETLLRTLKLSQLMGSESLELYDVVFDVEELLGFLSPMVQLKQLIISFLHLNYSVDYARAAVILHDTVDPVPKALRSLNVTFDDTNLSCTVMWLLGGTFDLGGLTDLAVSWNHFSLKDQAELLGPTKLFLGAVGPKIKQLQFCIPLHRSKRHDELKDTCLLGFLISSQALSHFKQLEVVEFKAPLERSYPSYLSMIVLLTSRTTFPNLRRIEVSVRFFSGKDDSCECLSVWSDLDAHFSSTNFPRLRFVTIGMFLDCDAADDDLVLTDISSMIKKRMPVLASRGCLKFQWQRYEDLLS